MDFKVESWGQTDARRVYARPRVPSKAQGRRGTRRAYKREFPPGVYVLVVKTDSTGRVTSWLTK